MERLIKISETIDNVLDCIHAIEECTNGLGFNDFLNNRKHKIFTVDKIEELILIVLKIPQEFKDSHPNVYWEEINGLQGKFFTDDLGIDEESVWNFIKKRLKHLEREFIKLSSELHKAMS